MKNLSRWAKVNRLSSRLIIAACHLLGLFNAIALGLLLYVIDLGFSQGLLLLTANLFFLAYFFYPEKPEGKKPQNHYFHRQKIHDFSLVVSSALVIALGVNQFVIIQERQAEGAIPAAQLIATRIIPQAETTVSASPGKGLREKASHYKQTILRELKAVKKEFKQQSREGRGNAAKIMLILLTVVVALGLGFLIAGLACNISCSGQEGLAVVVLLLGWGGIIWLSIITIRSIIRKYRARKGATTTD